MKRSGRIKWGNLWVGIFVTFAALLLLYTSFRGGGTSMFDSKGVVVTYFQNVNGLVNGAPVWLGGVEVGNVKSVHFVDIDPGRRIKAVLRVERSVWHFMTADAKVKLGTIGFLGDKYVEIIPGTPGLPVVKEGGELQVLGEGGLDALIAKMPAISGSIDTLLTNLKDISKRLIDGTGSAGRMMTDTMLYTNLVAALDKATTVLDELQHSQKRILDNLGSTLERADRVTAKIDSGQGSLGRLLNDDNLYVNVNRSTARLDSILSKIDRGEGSAGSLVNDQQLYEEIRNLVVRVENLVSDIEKNPRKYFKFSVF